MSIREFQIGTLDSMLKGDWYRLIAIVGVVLLLVSSAQAQEQTDESNGDADEQQALPFAVPVTIIESPEAADARDHRTQEAEQREKDDLVAQKGMNASTQRMADYAKWQTLLVFVGTAALIATLIFTWYANKAAWAAVRATEDVGRKQVRAYLGVESAKVEAVPGTGCYCFFQLKNFGQSPANRIEVKVRVQFTITAKGQTSATDKKTFDLMCNHPRALPPGAKERCAVFIQDRMNEISEMNLAEIRFYCMANVWWFDVYEDGKEQDTYVVMSQPLGTWTSEHWRGDLDVGGSEESGGWSPRHG